MYTAHPILPLPSGWLRAGVDAQCRDYSSIAASTPIVMDCGSSSCRVGWAGEHTPRLNFRPVIGRVRDRKEGETQFLVANDVRPEDIGRVALRSPFDGDLIYNFDSQEMILDFAFSRLGITHEGSVPHPIVVTEPPCNLNQCRRQMNELLFETYDVPCVTYGIAPLFAVYENSHLLPSQGRDVLLISCGAAASYVLVVLDGKVVPQLSQRLDLGGDAITVALRDLMKLRSDLCRSLVNVSHTEHLKLAHCYVAESFPDECQAYKEEIDYHMEKSNSGKSIKNKRSIDDDKRTSRFRIIQLPFVAVEPPTAEELQQRAEQRRKAGERLRAALEQQRAAKLQAERDSLTEFRQLYASAVNKDPDWRERLRDAGYKDKKTLGAHIDHMAERLKIAERKERRRLGLADVDDSEASDNDGAVPDNDDPRVKYPLVFVEDHTLSVDDLKQKKIQIFKMNTDEGRKRARLKRAEEKKKEEERALIEETFKKENPMEWKRSKIALRDSVANELAKLRKLQSERNVRGTAAYRARQKLTAEMAGSHEEDVDDADDTFGMNDDDWLAYNTISKDGGGIDDEVNDLESKLGIVENELEEFEAEFGDISDAASDEGEGEGEDRSEAETLALIERRKRDAWMRKQAQQYQIPLDLERIRCPEIVFQPSIVGSDQSGLIEIIDNVMRRANDIRAGAGNALAANILLHGGTTVTPGFRERVVTDVRALRPVGSEVGVVACADPVLDAWRGASHWASASPTSTSFIVDAFEATLLSRARYNEEGPEYLVEHALSNRYHPTPVLTEEELEVLSKRMKREKKKR